MSRSKRSPASPKARKNQSPVKEVTEADFARNSWTVKIAAAWSGMPERALYRLLRSGAAPCLPMGESQVQNWPAAKDRKRRRSCFRFVIPAKAFQTWWENIGKPNQG